MIFKLQGKALVPVVMAGALLSACGGGDPAVWMSQTLSTWRPQTLGSVVGTGVIIEVRQASAEALRALSLAGITPSASWCAQPPQSGLASPDINLPVATLLIEVAASAVEAARAAGYAPAQTLDRYEGLGPCETFPSPLPVGPVAAAITVQTPQR